MPRRRRLRRTQRPRPPTPSLPPDIHQSPPPPPPLSHPSPPTSLHPRLLHHHQCCLLPHWVLTSRLPLLLDRLLVHSAVLGIRVVARTALFPTLLPSHSPQPFPLPSAYTPPIEAPPESKDSSPLGSVPPSPPYCGANFRIT